MVHPVILSADIFDIICESLPRVSLAKLARTAKVLQDPALRELWRSIGSLLHLLSLFGSSVQINGKKIRFVDVPTSTQWDRFRFYARYVRALQIGHVHDTEVSCVSLLLHERPLLPRLESLDVLDQAAGRTIRILPMFFVASMQEFKIRPRKEDLPVLELVIASLHDNAPSLRDLAISLDSSDLPKLGISIPLFQNLYTIDIPLSGLQVASVLSHLSALPSLSKIRFCILDSGRLPGIDSRYMFPAARELNIVIVSDVQLLHFMAITQFNRLTNLIISCIEYQNDFDSLIRAIPISCGHFLEDIYIIAERDSRPLKFPTLDPLFRYTDLRFFGLVIDEASWPTDEDIQGIAKSWPNLQVFALQSSAADFLSHSTLSLSSLLSLIEGCTSLAEIVIAVDAKSIPSLTSPISHSELNLIINPFCSPIDSPKSLIDFLSVVLPNAIIHAEPLEDGDYGEYYRLWREVVSLQEENQRLRALQN